MRGAVSGRFCHLRRDRRMTTEQAVDFRQRVPLGRTGLRTSRLGIASSYGVGTEAVEAAYHEHGINYLYWGTFRTKPFGEAVRRLARTARDDLIIVLQSYSRVPSLVRPFLQRGLRRLGIEYADVLILGMFNHPPKPRLMETLHKLRDRGLFRHLGVSCHRRPTFQQYIAERTFDPIMFRYNAAHRGAERDIFPYLDADDRPGTVVYTATRWGHLLDPRRLPADEPTPRASDCYRFVLTQPLVDVCITGPADADQLREALATLDRGPMSDDELAWMRRVGDHVYHQPLGKGLRNWLRSIGGIGR